MVLVGEAAGLRHLGQAVVVAAQQSLGPLDAHTDHELMRRGVERTLEQPHEVRFAETGEASQIGQTQVLFESLLDEAIEMLRKLATLPLAFEPGTSFEYSIATDLLGHIIECVTGKPLDQALNELVLEPLKMRDTTFHVSDASLIRLV